MFDPDADKSADMTDLPFREASFDYAICSHVLEHIEDDRAAIAELYRVIAPGGRAIVMVPIDMKRDRTYEDASIDTAAARELAFGHPYHVRICGADYPGRLRKAGFVVNPIYSTSLSPHMRRYWRINKTLLFDCRKPRSF
jgi:SAM-dependent methyltransferase